MNNLTFNGKVSACRCTPRRSPAPGTSASRLTGFARVCQGGFGKRVLEPGHTILAVNCSWTKASDIGQLWERELKERARFLLEETTWEDVYVCLPFRTPRGALGLLQRCSWLLAFSSTLQVCTHAILMRATLAVRCPPATARAPGHGRGPTWSLSCSQGTRPTWTRLATSWPPSSRICNLDPGARRRTGPESDRSWTSGGQSSTRRASSGPQRSPSGAFSLV